MTNNLHHIKTFERSRFESLVKYIPQSFNSLNILYNHLNMPSIKLDQIYFFFFFFSLQNNIEIYCISATDVDTSKVIL